MKDRKPLLAIGAMLVFAAGFGLGYVVHGERAETPADGTSVGSAAPHGAEVLEGAGVPVGAPDGAVEGPSPGAAGAAGEADEGPQRGEGDVAVVGAGEPGGNGSGSTAGPSGDGVPLPGAGDASVPTGRLDAAAIQGVVREHREELGFCFAWQLHQHPDLAGRITMEFTIGEDGRVVRAAVANDELGDETVLRCFVNVTRRMEFPVPEDGEVSVRYPFILSPDDGESEE